PEIRSFTPFSAHSQKPPYPPRGPNPLPAPHNHPHRKTFVSLIAHSDSRQRFRVGFHSDPVPMLRAPTALFKSSLRCGPRALMDCVKAKQRKGVRHRNGSCQHAMEDRDLATDREFDWQRCKRRQGTSQNAEA
ncbi:MAG: hypothetical protein ACODAD_00375, partial [Planctomycetota bacterium]